ncbi:hypothetical protein [Acinetobacter baumannii]|uniref:hypothetical protein n=1 Tax=Acinetobacter baumannii TaxID=470 RepID=UPI003FA4D2FC
MKKTNYLILAIVIPVFANADPNIFTNEKYQYGRSDISTNTGENSEISTFNGSLRFIHNDIFIPGNGSLDLVIGRLYDTNKLSTGLSSSYSYKTSNILGPGWSLIGVPKVWYKNSYSANEDMYSNHAVFDYMPSPLIELCNKTPLGRDDVISFDPNGGFVRNSWGHAKLFIDLPSGETEQFFYTTDFKARTLSHWKLECLAGNIRVYSPDGNLYEFGNIDQDLEFEFNDDTGHNYTDFDTFPTNSNSFLSAKKLIDNNGNWIKYEYKSLDDKIPNINVPNKYYAHSDASLHWFNGVGSKVLSKIETQDGRVLSFDYDKNSKYLTKIQDNLDRVWNYTYSDSNIKNRSHNELFLKSVIFPDKSSYNFEYWGGQFAREFVPEALTDINSIKIGHISKIIFPTGGWISYDYDFINKRRFNSSKTKDYYNRFERVKQKQLSTGQKWVYKYAERVEGEPVTTTVEGPSGTEVYRFFDTLNVPDEPWMVGRLLEKSYSNGQVEKYTWVSISNEGFIPHNNQAIMNDYYSYNKLDKKIYTAYLGKRIITRDGGTYSTEYKNYDGYGNPGQIVETGPNSENRTTDYTYYNDINKWIIGKPKDEVTYIDTSKVGEIKRTYDNNGNLLTENKDGIINSNTYDSQGNIATSVNANGVTTTFSNYKRGIAQTEVQPEGVTITRVVDNAGNISSETNGAGHKTSYTYDELDRVTSVTPPTGNKTTITYTPTSKTTTRDNLVEVVNYDGFGRPKDSTKGGIKTTHQYDAFDNKTFESYPGLTTGTAFTYDALNRIKTISNPDNTKQTYEYGKASTSITDERGKKTTYNYRSYGNPEEQHLMSITAPVADANITLTRNGRDLVTTVKQKGLTRTYGYNSKYQLTSIDNPETGKTIYGRDNVGNMTSVKVGSSGTTTLTYDGRDRNTSITYPAGTAKVTKTYTKTDKLDSVSNTSTLRKYTYDANDNLLTDAVTLDSKTFTTTYAYNGKDQLSAITYPQSGSVIDYAPDALGRPTKVGSYITSISYWPSGQFKQLNYANGTVSNYGQNTRLWPSSFDTKKGTIAHLNNNYTYDGVGNLLTIADSTDSNFNRTATYDDINRLITAQGPWGAGTLTYDGMGNITKQNFGSQVLDYVYNTTTNKLSSTSGSKLGTYSYDVLGNITSDGANTYSYDAVPSLICAKCNDSTKRVDYSYDGLNKRVSVTKAGVKRYEILATNGDQLIEFIPSQNNKLTEYFYLGGKRIAQRVSP